MHEGGVLSDRHSFTIPVCTTVTCSTTMFVLHSDRSGEKGVFYAVSGYLIAVVYGKRGTSEEFEEEDFKKNTSAT